MASRALRAKLDECLRRHPAMGLVLAASLSEHVVLLQRTRADLDAAAAAAMGASTDADADLEDYLAATNGSAAGAIRQATEEMAATSNGSIAALVGGQASSSSSSVPPPRLVETYVSLAAQCAAPFSDAFDPKKSTEWSVARFYPAGWEVSVYRDTARQIGAAGDSAATGEGETPTTAAAAAAAATDSDGVSPLDFVLVCFSRLDVLDEAPEAA